MKKIIMILLVVATMGMAEEGVQATDTNNTTIETTTAVEKPVEQERGLLGSIGYGAGAVLGGLTYGAVAIVTSPLHLFNLDK